MKRNPCIYLTLIFTILLGAHKGHLALWRQGESYPVRIYPLHITSLPPADQALLLQGIPVENEAHLAHLLEDYLS